MNRSFRLDDNFQSWRLDVIKTLLVVNVSKVLPEDYHNVIVKDIVKLVAIFPLLSAVKISRDAISATDTVATIRLFRPALDVICFYPSVVERVRYHFEHPWPNQNGSAEPVLSLLPPPPPKEQVTDIISTERELQKLVRRHSVAADVEVRDEVDIDEPIAGPAVFSLAPFVLPIICGSIICIFFWARFPLAVPQDHP